MPLQTKQHSTWSDEDKQQLLRLIWSCRTEQDKIDWDRVAEEMPQKTRLQCKSYFTNYLKPKVGIENQTTRLPSEEIPSFILNCLRCNKNWAEVKRRFYPDQSPQSIRQKYTRMVNYKVELFACYEPLMKYPDTGF